MAVLGQQGELRDHATALQALAPWLRREQLDAALTAVGHCIVHDGDRYDAPLLIDDVLIAALERLIMIDPEHLPQALSAIQARAEPIRPSPRWPAETPPFTATCG